MKKELDSALDKLGVEISNVRSECSGLQMLSIAYREVKQQVSETIKDYEEVLEDQRRLVREIDVLLNGENAAKQASLCDIVSQIRSNQMSRQQPCSGFGVTNEMVREIATRAADVWEPLGYSRSNAYDYTKMAIEYLVENKMFGLYYKSEINPLFQEGVGNDGI